MRSLFLTTALAFMSLAGTQVSQATEGPWCFNSKDQEMNCSIPSRQQCIFIALPVNGQCWPNPNYYGKAQAAPRAKHITTRRRAAQY